ncbi:rhodanese-like domain-containing protein [Sediminibacillus albus]|uniref:Rhodanese-related sulfurtransferase n=1 Tax=Sediminibacillus albus TaxID=407036 RepID=A0A1G8Z2P6_9BACI|nr:rhodanese-like domain-containing protein [Sediminibacillus albus]SDK09348.1 Rhodanese-related sulfurtransferase [Sediminibacillus albus]
MDDIKEITSTELQDMLDEKSDIVLIDVRENEEVAQGMIEEAEHIPLREIPEALKELDKQKNYVLICHSGMRSMNAALFMNEEGFKVMNLTGGMLEWDGEIVV